jgi:predicted MFS family arabinose efflux permease
MLKRIDRRWPRAGRFRDHTVALGLGFGAVVALGFTRFAYALLLPEMRAELGWSYTSSGGLGTANALGYVLGAATAAVWANRLGAHRTFIWSMALSALGLFATATTASYSTLTAIRLVGGYTTAVTFVLGSVLATRINTRATHKVSALLVALYMSGVGVGVAVSGVAVPAVLGLVDSGGWRAGWIVMGALATLALAPAAHAAARVPEPDGQSTSRPERGTLRLLAPTLAWYTLFGAGYVSYMTFVIALLREEGLGPGEVATFFVVLGLTSAAATLTLWGRVLGHLHGGRAPALVAVVVAAGVLPLLVLPAGLPTAMLSAVVFGGSFMAGPTAATVLARRTLSPSGWAAGIAVLTVAFSVGQSAGPVLAGLVSDGPGGISRGLWLSTALLAGSAVVALAQRAGPGHQQIAPVPR